MCSMHALQAALTPSIMVIKRQMHAWLKAGVMPGFQLEKQRLTFATQATPQGVSLLLS